MLSGKEGQSPSASLVTFCTPQKVTKKTFSLYYFSQRRKVTEKSPRGLSEARGTPQKGNKRATTQSIL